MKYRDDANSTPDWRRYENGKSYNRKLKPLSYYDNVSMNWDFFNGYQYPGLDDVDVPKPVFNIINRLVQFFVSSITSTKVAVNIEPMAYIDDDTWNMSINASELANAQINNLFDQFRMPIKIRKAMTDGAVSGDYCAHLYFDTNKKPYGGMLNSMGAEGEIQLDLVDGNNVYFGNPNTPIISKDIQPYIIISGRDTVENLIKEAEQNKENNPTITGDTDYQEQVGQGGKIEIDADDNNTDKATYIIIYKPNKNGTISVSKCTQGAYIFKDIDTGLSEYPIAWGNWEEQKNQYHGKALVTGLIPNQIYINRAFGILMYFLMNNAFQKPVYDADKISSWTSDVGVALPVHNLQPGDNVRNVAAYLDNGSANPQVVETIELAKSMTLELSGATEAALGSIKPENTSAIIAVTRQAAIPLENPRANMKEWVNDIVKIMLDMMATKYGIRDVVIEREGQKVVEQFDFSQIKDIYLNTNIQVGDGSYYSEIAALQTLDNLMAQDRITAIQYFERVEKINPDYIPDVKTLIEELKQQQMQQIEQMQMEEEQQALQQQDQQMLEFVKTLPEEIQVSLAQLPEEDRNQRIMGMMQDAQQMQ